MSASIPFTGLFRVACFSMFGLIGIGAMYGHKGRIQEERVYMFNRAQLYHLLNNVGLICTSLMPAGTLPYQLAVGGFSLGLLAFCIPLYYMAVNGKTDMLSKTMPVGGIAMMTGWVSLMFM